MSTTEIDDRGAHGSCGDYEPLVGPLLDGELPSGERAEIEEHVSACASCRTLAEDFRRLDRLAHAAAGPLPRVAPEEWGQLWEDIRRQLPPATARSRPRLAEWIVPVLSAAALVLLAVWIGISLASSSGTKSTDPKIVGNPDGEIQIEGAGPGVKIESDEDGHLIDYVDG